MIQSNERERPRIDIVDLFREGKSLARTEKLKRLANSLQWRHKYQNTEEYCIVLLDKRVITLRQVLNGELKGLGTGVFVWPAAHVLSKYLEKRYGSDGLCGQRVCDIGSGTGCTGFISAALGAHVTLTDQDQLISFLEINKHSVCAVNKSIDAERIDIKVYDWGRSAEHLNSPFDIILISDCVLPKLYPILPLIEVSND
jgi:predicted nicotinamide N-methyase